MKTSSKKSLVEEIDVTDDDAFLLDEDDGDDSPETVELDPETGEVASAALFQKVDGMVAGPLLYPSPKSEPRFKAHWDKLIVDVSQRPNMKESHLTQLVILCDLYVELDDLNKLIRTKGLTYRSVTRQGDTIRVRPEVTQKNRVIAEIRNYSKALGLILHKDQVRRDEPDAESWS